MTNQRISNAILCLLFFQSLDYEVCENRLFQEEQKKTTSQLTIRKDISRWLIFILIGIITALIACGINIVIEELSARKYAFLKKGKLFISRQATHYTAKSLSVY